MSDYSYLWRSPIKPIDDFNQSFGSGVNKVAGGIGDAVSSTYKTGKHYVKGVLDNQPKTNTITRKIDPKTGESQVLGQPSASERAFQRDNSTAKPSIGQQISNKYYNTKRDAGAWWDKFNTDNPNALKYSGAVALGLSAGVGAMALAKKLRAKKNEANKIKKS